MIKCKKCGYNEDESKIELHHIIPKSCGGTDLDGRVYLCEKCHDILHKELTKQFWKYIDKKEECKNNIKNYTKWFVNRDKK